MQLTVKELGERWSISARTIQRRCKSGVIQSFNAGTESKPLYRIPIDFVLASERNGKCINLDYTKDLKVSRRIGLSLGQMRKVKLKNLALAQ